MNLPELHQRLVAEGYERFINYGTFGLSVNDLAVVPRDGGFVMGSFERETFHPDSPVTDEDTACAELYRWVSCQIWCAGTSDDVGEIERLTAALHSEDIKVWRNDIPGYHVDGRTRYRIFVPAPNLKRAAEIAASLSPLADDKPPTS